MLDEPAGILSVCASVRLCGDVLRRTNVHGRLGRVHVCVPRVCKTSLLRQIAAFLMKPQVKCFKRTFILLRRRLPPAEGRRSKEGEDAVLYAI